MLKVGVIGAGHLGKFHLNNWGEIEGIQLIGFCDTDDANAKLVSEKYNIPRYTETEKLIDDCDALDIVAPTSFHFEICEAAIKKGKHVFVEKPLANTMDEARELVKLAKEANIKFQVGHVERFNPAFLSLKEYNLSPMFIEVHRLAQFNPRGTDVSVILDLMIHDIDIILSLVKSNVNYISANGVAVMSDTPDIANVRIEFDNGCVANLTASRISVKNMRKMRIFQQGAYISLDFLKKKSEIFTIHDQPLQDENFFELELNNKNKKYIQFTTSEPQDINAIKMELELFLASIKNNTPVPVSIHDGLRAMEVSQMIIEKIKKQLLLKEL